MSQESNLIITKLKSINEIKSRFPFYKELEESLSHKKRFMWDSHGWVINGDMVPKFDDGVMYQFEPTGDHSGYTHKCIQDGYYYSELWFELDHTPIIEFNEKEFLL